MSRRASAISNWALGGGAKIERAKEHLGELQRSLIALEKLDAYGVVFQNDAKGWRCVARVNEVITTQHLPRLGAIAGDTIHNLRSALDVLWVDVMGERSRNKAGGFRIHENAEAFQATRGRRVKGRRQTALDVLAEIKPYRGGNDLLWKLHALDIAQKHHTLLAVVGVLAESRVRNTPDLFARASRPGGLASIRITELHAMHDGRVLAGGTAPMSLELLHQVRDNTEFVFHIALHEPGVADHEAVLPLLHRMTRLVDGVVESFRIAGWTL